MTEKLTDAEILALRDFIELIPKAQGLLERFNDDPEELKVKLEVFDNLAEMIVFVKELIEERERWLWLRQGLYNSAKWLVAVVAGIAAIKSGIIQDIFGGSE